MSYIAIITDGELVELNRDDLSRGDLQTADAYLDAVDYLLYPHDHPGRMSQFTVADFARDGFDSAGNKRGVRVGGMLLETDERVLLAMGRDGTLDDIGEKHSL